MAEQTLSTSEQKKEDWMNSKWRPMMGWVYMATCTADFVIFPILWSVLQSISHGQVTSQWQPLTLQGAGLYHIAMGAVLGLAAFGRTQEKLAGANNGGAGANLPTSFGTTYTPPPASGGTAPSSTNTPAPTSSFSGSTGFGAPTSGPVNPAPSWGTTPISTAPAVVTGFGGKPAPAQPEQPAI
jgi:hypothetical protein